MSFKYLQVLEGTAMKSISKDFPTFIIILTAIILTISDGRDAKRLKRLYGGKNAKPGQQNWVVSLAFKDDTMWNFCGGAIIGTRHILTAAHCFETIPSSTVIVRSGITALNDKTAIETDILNVILHPEYVPKIGHSYSWNDIAILELKRDLPFGNRTSEIRLPTEEPQEVIGFFAGWGLLDKKKPSAITKSLQTAKMKVITDRECEDRGRHGRRPYFICAYLSGGMLLQGDSGGPLTYNGEIIGIASNGPRKIGSPMSFTNVFHYSDWIKVIVSSENNV